MPVTRAHLNRQSKKKVARRRRWSSRAPALPPLPASHAYAEKCRVIEISVNSLQNASRLGMFQHVFPQPVILLGTNLSKCAWIAKGQMTVSI